MNIWKVLMIMDFVAMAGIVELIRRGWHKKY